MCFGKCFGELFSLKIVHVLPSPDLEAAQNPMSHFRTKQRRPQ